MKIRSDILRNYKTMHTWVGIVAGLFLFIGFFAGSLTMFKHALDRWVSPPAHVLSGVVPEQYDQLITQVLSKYPDSARELTFHLTEDESVIAPVSWYEHGSRRELSLTPTQTFATLDQQGQLNVQMHTPSVLAELIDMLHRTAGIPGEAGHEYVGEYVMGGAAVLYFLALVSGVIILLPLMVKDFFSLRTKKGERRFWLDSHNIIGITSLPFHLVISLTVIVFVFHDQFYDGLRSAVYGEKPLFSSNVTVPQDPFETQHVLPVSSLIKRAEQQAPDFDVTQMLFINLESTRPRVRLSLSNPDYLVRGPETAYMTIHPYSGEVLDVSTVPGQDMWGGIVSTFFALHFGSFGGDLVRWVYFFMGLAGAFLFYSGNLLWIERRRKKQTRSTGPAVQLKSHQLLAALTVGVCLGSIVGVCLTMVAAKWLYPLVANVNHYYLLVYYCVFITSIIWSVWQGPARGAAHLLTLSGVAALAIPVTSLLAWYFPTLGMWTNTSFATISVDFVALCSAAIFLYLSNLTVKRAINGPKDSVWSYSKNKQQLVDLDIGVKPKDLVTD